MVDTNDLHDPITVIDHRENHGAMDSRFLRKSQWKTPVRARRQRDRPTCTRVAVTSSAGSQRQQCGCCKPAVRVAPTSSAGRSDQQCGVAPTAVRSRSDSSAGRSDQQCWCASSALLFHWNSTATRSGRTDGQQCGHSDAQCYLRGLACPRGLVARTFLSCTTLYGMRIGRTCAQERQTRIQST